MRSLASRLVACSLVGLLAACGSNGGTVPSVPPANLPSIVTVSNAGATASFYRVGSTGSWTAVPAAPPAQFTVPLGQTSFSVAYLCDGEQVVINALVTETTNVSTPCIVGGLGPLTSPTSTEVGGTYDGTALLATNATVISPESDSSVNVPGGSGSYANLATASGNGNTFALAVTDDNANVLGFKTLRNVATTGPSATVNFPALTSTDAAITEPISVTGLTGQDSIVSVNYLPSGPPAFDDSGFPILTAGIQVNHFTPTAYSGVPPADWQTGDLYAELFGSASMVGSNEYLTYHASSALATGPIVATMPTLSQIPVNPTDYSFPLTYSGLPASDVVRGFLASVYTNTDGIAEIDISSPGWLAGRSSYAPLSLAGATGMVTMTPATLVLAGYITFGATYVPTFTTDFLSLAPPPGQSLDIYVSAYSPTIPGPTLTRRMRSALGLVEGDRVPVRILQP